MFGPICYDCNRAIFWQRLHNETVREFGITLQLVVNAFPFVEIKTKYLLAKDHFIAHVRNGDLLVSLCSAKPAILEDTINFAAELQHIRHLKNSCLAPDARVRVVTEKCDSADQVDALLVVVESLRQ